MALEKNISLQQAKNKVNANIIDQKTVQNKLLPSVSYNIGHYFSFGKNIDPVTNIFTYQSFSGGYTSVNLQLQLFDGFSRVNAVKQSTYLIQSSEYAKKRKELEILSNITLTYARVLFDKEQLEAVKSNMASTYKQIESVNEKIKVGRTTKYEAYIFNARLNTERANEVSIRNDLSAGLQELKNILNLPSRDTIDIAQVDTTFINNIYAANVSANKLIEAALQNHPAIQEAKMNEQAVRLGEKIARSNFYPSLSIGGNVISNYNVDQTNINGGKVPVNRQLNDNLGQNIYINLRIPIFSQMENSNQVKKERINISNAQLSIQEAENTVTTNIMQLVNDFNAAKQKYTATLSSWQQNIYSYSMYEEKYKLGLASSLELLTSKDILNASASNYIQAKLELFFKYKLLELVMNYNNNKKVQF